MVKKKNENIVVDENLVNTTPILDDEVVLNEAQAIDKLSSNIEENEPKTEDIESNIDEQTEKVVDEQPELIEPAIIEEEQAELVVDEIVEPVVEVLKSEVKQLNNVNELNYSQHRHYLRTGRIPK
jgi:DNA-binding GntR family transcriptional regulator